MRISGLIIISILFMFIYLYLSPSSLAQQKTQDSVTPTLYCLGSCDTTPAPTQPLPSVQTPTNSIKPSIGISPAVDPCINEPVQQALHSGRKEKTPGGFEKIINLLLQLLFQLLQQLLLRFPVVPFPTDPTLPVPLPTPQITPIPGEATPTTSPPCEPTTSPSTPTPITPTPTPVQSVPTPTLTANNPRVNPICVSSHLDEVSNSEIDTQLNLMQEAGVKWTRFDFVRAAVEHSAGVYDWTKYDYIVNNAKAKGIEVLALITQWGVPEWESYRQDYMYPDTASGYARFAKEVAGHFKGTITLYEIGNEPNLRGFWPPSPNPEAYTQMLIEGFNAIKEVDPNAKVISAGLAGYQADYVQSMYQNGAKGHFDYFGMHPYSWPKGPDEFNNSQYSFSALLTLKNKMAENDDSKPIMATEVGWTTFSDGVNEASQATYTQRVFEKIMKEDYQYVPIACIYDFKNDGTDPNDEESNFGIIRNDFTKKPVFSTLQNMRKYFDANYTPILP